MKPFAIAFAYLSLIAFIGLPILKGGWFTPPQFTPPEDWPMTKESRDQFHPQDDVRHAVQYFIP